MERPVRRMNFSSHPFVASNFTALSVPSSSSYMTFAFFIIIFLETLNLFDLLSVTHSNTISSISSLLGFRPAPSRAIALRHQGLSPCAIKGYRPAPSRAFALRHQGLSPCAIKGFPFLSCYLITHLDNFVFNFSPFSISFTVDVEEFSCMTD